MKDDVTNANADEASAMAAGHHLLTDAVLDKIAGGAGGEPTMEHVTIVNGCCPFCGQDMVTKGLIGRLTHETSPTVDGTQLMFVCENTGRMGVGEVTY